MPIRHAVNEWLSDKEAAAKYLREHLGRLDQRDGIEDFLLALRAVVVARGGIQDAAGLSKKTGKAKRTTLYGALSKKGNPTLKTLCEILKGCDLSFEDLITDKDRK
jgi:DNA-binding phage protein